MDIRDTRIESNDLAEGFNLGFFYFNQVVYEAKVSCNGEIAFLIITQRRIERIDEAVKKLLSLLA